MQATEKFLIYSPVAVLKPDLKSVIYGPSKPHDPLVAVVPSLLKQVYTFIPFSPPHSLFKSLSKLFIDHDTAIPSYFNDDHLLVHLAFLLDPQLGDQSLEKVAFDYLTDEDEEDVEGADLEILEEAPAVFVTPRKKRVLKVKEKLDDSFLRRSKRLAKKFDGYKDAESAKKGKETAVVIDDEPMPLAIIPPPVNEAAPHLPRDFIEGIATGFLQIQPETVSVALPKKDNLDG